jgi:4-hydroxythreonine-4-phosphate dehydrogenase
MYKVALSMGDPAGIGPEVILKSLSENPGAKIGILYVFGDASVLYETSRSLGLPFHWPVISIESFRQHIPNESCIVDLANVHGRIHMGTEKIEYGRASMEFIEAAVYSCMEGTLDALVTAPINKKSIHLAGFDFPGHTEYLAALTNTQQFAMSFHSGNIWTVLTTTHLPLSEALKRVRKDHLVSIIQLAYRELRPFVANPALAVASLNPHGAEGGLFGMEESMEIAPAIDECRQAGIPVSGPYSADTIFLRALKGEFPIVIAHYHDQGMIPVKLMSFGKAVNVTLGLPFLRTSVDHGTAFDIAGRGIASPESMLETLRLTLELLSERDALSP